MAHRTSFSLTRSVSFVLPVLGLLACSNGNGAATNSDSSSGTADSASGAATSTPATTTTGSASPSSTAGAASNAATTTGASGTSGPSGGASGTSSSATTTGPSGASTGTSGASGSNSSTSGASGASSSSAGETAGTSSSGGSSGGDQSSVAGGEPELHIYLALGQSNMQGAAQIPDNPPFHERVQVLQSENCPQDGNEYGYGEWRPMFQPIVMCKEGTGSLPAGSPPIGLGPADSFAVAMAEAAGPNVTIGIVGAAHGGTSIEQHLPGCMSACLPDWANNINGAPVVNGTTPLFNWVIDLAKKAQEQGEIKGIIFHQGENNSGDSSWPGKVNEYVKALRMELGLDAAAVPFIAGELPYTGCCPGHNSLVQQLPSQIENAHFVSAGPMEDGTVLGLRSSNSGETHWSSDAVIEMGKRYAAKMLEAQGK